MRVNLCVRILAIALVCAVVSLAGSAVAGAVTVRAGTYVGVTSHGGVVLIAVGPGGRAITPLSIIGAAEGGVGFDRVRIRRGGRFDRKIADGEGEESVAGRITSSGLVRGHYRFVNRGGAGSGSFSARFVRGLAGQGERIFSLYGSDNQAADTTTNLDRSGVPATETGSLPVGVTQLPDGRIVVVDAPARTRRCSTASRRSESSAASAVGSRHEDWATADRSRKRASTTPRRSWLAPMGST